MRSIISSLAAFSLIVLLAGCRTVNQPTPYGTGSDDSNTVNPLTNLNPALGTYGGSSAIGSPPSPMPTPASGPPSAA